MARHRGACFAPSAIHSRTHWSSRTPPGRACKRRSTSWSVCRYDQRLLRCAHTISVTQAMSTPANYLVLFADMPDTVAQAEASALQQATYTKQLRALDRCLAGLRSNLCVSKESTSLRHTSKPPTHRAELDACVQRLGRHVQECRRLFAGLSTAAQHMARPPVPSPVQLINNLHTVWCVWYHRPT